MEMLIGRALQFQSFHSSVDAIFWHQLSSYKVEQQKLDASPVVIHGRFNTYSRSAISIVFGKAPENSSIKECIAEGTLINANTQQEFVEANVKEIRESMGKKLLESIEKDTVAEKPNELIQFLLFSYADIKSYRYHYWCLFPSLKNTSLWIVKGSQPAESVIPSNIISPKILEFWKTSDFTQRSFFIVAKNENGRWLVLPLKELPRCLNNRLDYFIFVVDSFQLQEYPSWPTRNLLAYLSIKFNLEKTRIIMYRDGVNSDSLSRSIYLDLVSQKNQDSSQPLSTVGWERNGKGQLGPRVVNLSSLIDPVLLSESASMLNLSLMRWRLVPQLNLGIIQNTKCLLLGAGTLGCGVARNLVSWGVRHITFVDYSNVAYSNPVRQSLFTFEDCKRKHPKAQCAASRLKEIYPKMFSEGHSISIPMLGHPIYKSEVERTKRDYQTLENLFLSHDAIFLLTDTRESRWLPTVMATSLNKILINSALGFDSWLVMRHGSLSQGENRLGCYFCNDVFAPSNSVIDRTLDQTCTVTRAGCTNIATAIAVELFVSLLQHPDGIGAPVCNKDATVLGELPHQIRGFLHDYSLFKISGKAYQQCSACSECIINEWKKRKWDFVLQAINDSDYVEELCGLRLVQQLGERAGAMEEWDSDNESILA
ncbi:ubiquitin-like conjugating enzyme Atg7 [Schizosaccharomyces cryophilus OY26]|uniref:Ubiquitin-like modifier-activating enzyme ATG7 n=1 Tax=Schizosaccharomyces cryophilus (strain OY26 / ATCC MYA-4695 / CBS 11777 / NBRC 106824 / NRRL Y48691) TaxID=653667 RepID=S9W1I6_SCHCR|nr:ubiquitin-like conjugating enzyme Atg7 [Schizosaccharomyces cryophilus OY26]EPY53853.1 ubiquitin-like conjugating enzyme Atg7 [Schizosaccharomyces cryophilus OY26]